MELDIYCGEKLLLEFKRRMLPYQERMDSFLNKRVGTNTEAVKAWLHNLMYLPTLHKDDFIPIFKMIGVTKFSSEDAIAFCYHYTKQYGTLAYRLIYRHHPYRYKIFKEIYAVLKKVGSLESSDLFNLVIGRKGLEVIPEVRLVDHQDARVLFESDNYYFKLSMYSKVFDSNLRESSIWVKYQNPMLCPIELIYPEKNLIVLPKCRRDLKSSEIKELMTKRLRSGWVEPDGLIIEYKNEDSFAVLNNNLVLFDYFMSKEVTL